MKIVLSLITSAIVVSFSTLSWAAPAVDHYQCYGVKSDPIKKEVRLKDQFGGTKAVVKGPVELCNPVSKNGEPIVNKAIHLTCYEIVEADPIPPITVLTSDQFGEHKSVVTKRHKLCLPAKKEVLDRPKKG